MNAALKATGVNPVTIQRYIEGKTKVPASMLAAIARATNVSPGWLLSGEMPTNPVAEPDSDVFDVPRLEVRASAGSGLVAMPGEGSGFPISSRWLRGLGIAPANAEFLHAEGDSMEPTIKDGDLMLVDRGYGEVANGKIYVLVVNGLVLVKRVQVLALGGLMLISDNERYPTQTISRSEVNDLSIEARVAWYGRTI